MVIVFFFPTLKCKFAVFSSLAEAAHETKNTNKQQPEGPLTEGPMHMNERVTLIGFLFTTVRAPQKGPEKWRRAKNVEKCRKTF